MRHLFPLFQSPLDFAHQFFEKLLLPEDIAIDATCGNGHDTLVLAKLLPNGKVVAIDLQPQAINKTKTLLEGRYPQVIFHQRSHETFPEDCLPESIKLIVYNLGYLPGGDKTVTTKREKTLNSLKNGLPLIQKGGCISITCYPGHAEGEEEEKALLPFCRDLSREEWSVSYTQWINRTKSPSHILIQRGSAEETK